MSMKTIGLAAIVAVVFGAGGYLAGVEIAGRGPSAAVAEKAVAEYLAANPALLKPAEPAPAPAADAASADAEIAKVEGIVRTFLAANPDLLKSAEPAATPVPAAPAADAGLSNAQITEVEGIVRTYLVANPEIIRDAMMELQRKQDEAERADQVKAIADNRDALFNSARQVVLGNPKGDVTIVEFFDYNCGYCKRAHADMLQLLDEDKDLRIVLKEFPVLGEGSVQAAQVSIAVRLVAPEKSAEFFNALLDEKGQINGAKALALAEELGIDRAKLDEAMKTDEVKATIEESYDLANKLSLTGTPSYVTAQEVVVGAVGYDALKEKIATARAACATTSC